MPEKLFQWIRSTDMSYVKMVINETAIHEFVDRTGTMNNVQYTDLNYEETPSQRRFISQIRRCDEMEHRLAYFETLLKKYCVKVEDNLEIGDFLETIKENKDTTPEYILNSLDILLEKQEKTLKELSDYSSTLATEYNEKVEQKYVLESANKIFQSNRMEELPVPVESERTSLLERGNDSIRFGYIAGVIKNEDISTFERMIFRATRGNCLVRLESIPVPLADPITGRDVNKSVFVVLYRSSIIENKVRKIVDAFNAHAYDIADLNDPANIRAAHAALMIELQDAESVLHRSVDKCEVVLRDVAKYYRAWQWTIKKEKAVFDVFNKFKPVAGGNMYGEGWVITEQISQLEAMIEDVHRGKDSNGYLEVMQKPWPKAPTHFKTNQFTAITQSVIDTYGVPTYKEVNPAVFTLVTFPFQFGIMFGDLGHAIFVTLIALYFLINAEKMKKNGMNEIIGMIFSGRSMIILMGIYAMYVGFLYNDQFSLGIDWFGTTWSFAEEAKKGLWNGHVYPVGLDPIWHGKANNLLFYNSFKMKFAVIFGVSQMILGVYLKFMNCFHYRHWIDFWCEAVPQMLFLLSFFGYMLFIIFYKWLVNWDERMAQHMDPPSLINTLINIALKPGQINGSPLYPHQGEVQKWMLILAVISVPWMLLVKPAILYIKLKLHPHVEVESEVMKNPTLPHDETEPTSLMELIIFQGIETIEYCLGCISHTASYLRLWALSLAHSQLSEVFWKKIFQPALDSGNPIMLYVMFVFFALATLGVLLVMDALECYLHALRLHWVEFQNKFFGGKGYKFAPLNYHDLLVGEDW